MKFERQSRVPKPGICLCLSGGGFRAMLFHVGVVRRLWEVGLLERLSRVSSVSGGSITAGVLAKNWDLVAGGTEKDLDEYFVRPLRKFADRRVDVFSILFGLLPFGSVSGRVTATYEKHLFGRMTLQDLPDAPEFVFNTTSLQSTVLFRFMKRYMRDYRVGEIKLPKVPLATVVAASSAFPPFLSPAILRVDPADFETPDPKKEDLHRTPYTSRLVLSDGGVYDNFGLEAGWNRHRTLLVSDAGGKTREARRPLGFWPLQILRVLHLVDNQVRSLRKRWLIERYQNRVHDGAFWGIRTKIANYELPDSLPCCYRNTLALAQTKTRLTKMKPILKDRLINWGYAVSDAALRRHYDSSFPPPKDFPYPASAV